MTIALPTLDEVVVTLCELAEVDSIDPDAPVADIGVDSLDLLEWSYTLEEAHGVEFDESLLEGIEPTATLRSVYDVVMTELRRRIG